MRLEVIDRVYNFEKFSLMSRYDVYEVFYLIGVI
jgi:hypothetical protein